MKSREGARLSAQIKETLIRAGVFEDGVPCHLVSGLGAGFFAVCFGSPVDVIKSRMMGDAPLACPIFTPAGLHDSSSTPSNTLVDLIRRGQPWPAYEQ